MRATLSTVELCDLVRRVFAPGPGERGLMIMVDLPDDVAGDHGAWAQRREMAADWAARLAGAVSSLSVPRVTLVHYRNTRRPNQKLPELAHPHDGGPCRATGKAGAAGAAGSPAAASAANTTA